jgi:hypothetical protein
MSEFEYLAVFISIIFGISVTHILSGFIRSIYRGEKDQTHNVLTAFFFLVLILNWWVGFSWVDQEIWSFDKFLIIVIWSVTHYVAAITLYPPLSAGVEHPFEYRRNWFLWAFTSAVFMDILQTAARGALFKPWYYLPFVAHYAVVALLTIFINKAGMHRWVAWYLLVVTASWAFVVRRFLVD